MGNQVAKEFYAMELGKGSMCKANALRIAMVPDAVVIDSPMVVSLQIESKSIQYFDLVTKKRLFVTSLSESTGSTTRDANGHVLYIMKSPDRSTRLIYKPNSDEANGEEPDDDEASLAKVARIEIDATGSCRTAILTIKDTKKEKNGIGEVSKKKGGEESSTNSATSGSDSKNTKDTKKSNGTKSSDSKKGKTAKSCYIDVYKAVEIPAVKFGVVVIDMKGEVVGKASHDPASPMPMVLVAPGSDAAAIVALACILKGEL